MIYTTNQVEWDKVKHGQVLYRVQEDHIECVFVIKDEEGRIFILVKGDEVVPYKANRMPLYFTTTIDAIRAHIYRCEDAIKYWKVRLEEKESVQKQTSLQG